MTAEANPAPIPLYYGDNGSQDFWESANRQTILMCNKSEKIWFVLHEGQCLPDKPASKRLEKERGASPGAVSVTLGGVTPKSTANKLLRQYGIAVTFELSKQWGPERDRRGAMILRPRRKEEALSQ